MAEFIQYGGSNGGNYASYFSCKLSVWENSYDINSNSSNVGYRLELISGSSGRFSGLTASFTVCIDSQGSPQYNQGSGTYSSQSYNTAQTICEGTFTVYHNTDGTKNIGCWASLDFQGHTYSPGDFSPSGYMDLTTIPRYTTVTNNVRNKTMNSISINWWTTDARDHTQYSLNGGAWQDAYDTVASDNKSGYYTISNLNTNTTYTVRTRCKRADSGLWSEASTLTITTYDIARISSLNDFEHGSNANVTITNPARDI